MITHSDVKPFPCTLCDFSTARKARLSKHMSNKHGAQEQQKKSVKKRVALPKVPAVVSPAVRVANNDTPVAPHALVREVASPGNTKARLLAAKRSKPATKAAADKKKAVKKASKPAAKTKKPARQRFTSSRSSRKKNVTTSTSTDDIIAALTTPSAKMNATTTATTSTTSVK
jgi:hypothetical protein